MKRFITSWSGGKDSCYAMMKSIEAGHIPCALLNMMNENGKVSRSHAIPKHILQQQAAVMDLPLQTAAATWAAYERSYIDTLKKATQQFELEAAVFGDIDLQPHKDWEEKVCAAAGIEAMLPLW